MTEIKCKKRIGYPDSIPDRIEFIDRIATDYGWLLIEYQDNIGMMHYHKIKDPNCQIKIYITKMSAIIYFDFDEIKTQAYHKFVNVSFLKLLFI